MPKLADRVAIVTGANKGIGKGIARGLAREGASVVCAARGTQELDRTVAEIGTIGPTGLAVPCDVTDESQVESLFARAMDQFGRVDLLVNNAGAFDGGPIDELTTEAWDRVIAVNLRGPFLCTRAAMRIMKKQGGGRIINIGSISAQRVRPASAPYAASKHGVWGLTQATALEGRDHHITCCCLHPGNVLVERRESGLHEGREQDVEPMMTVDEISEVAILMATLPPHVQMLEAIVLPRDQLYIGRG